MGMRANYAANYARLNKPLRRSKYFQTNALAPAVFPDMVVVDAIRRLLADLHDESFDRQSISFIEESFVQILQPFSRLKFTIAHKIGCYKWPVWPDLAIFENTGQQTFVQNKPQYYWLFRLLWKTSLLTKKCCDYFWAIFGGKIGLLLTPTYGHTESTTYSITGTNS